MVDTNYIESSDNSTTDDRESEAMAIAAGMDGGKEMDEEKVSHYVYRDLSHVKPSKQELRQLKSSQWGPDQHLGQKLPVKLHSMLANPALEDIITWLPHGRSWKVIDRTTFKIEVLPSYFDHSNIDSFFRLVNAWGFRRIPAGLDRDSYYHELFLRGMPHLHGRMKRTTKKETKAPVEFEDRCPNFYDMPLPEPSTPVKTNTPRRKEEGGSNSRLKSKPSKHDEHCSSEPQNSASSVTDNTVTASSPAETPYNVSDTTKTFSTSCEKQSENGTMQPCIDIKHHSKQHHHMDIAQRKSCNASLTLLSPIKNATHDNPRASNNVLLGSSEMPSHSLPAAVEARSQYAPAKSGDCVAHRDGETLHHDVSNLQSFQRSMPSQIFAMGNQQQHLRQPVIVLPPHFQPASNALTDEQKSQMTTSTPSYDVQALLSNLGSLLQVSVQMTLPQQNTVHAPVIDLITLLLHEQIQHGSSINAYALGQNQSDLPMMLLQWAASQNNQGGTVASECNGGFPRGS